jgi:hypothetical protein
MAQSAARYENWDGQVSQAVFDLREQLRQLIEKDREEADECVKRLWQSFENDVNTVIANYRRQIETALMNIEARYGPDFASQLTPSLTEESLLPDHYRLIETIFKGKRDAFQPLGPSSPHLSTEQAAYASIDDSAHVVITPESETAPRSITAKLDRERSVTVDSPADFPLMAIDTWDDHNEANAASPPAGPGLIVQTTTAHTSAALPADENDSLPAVLSELPPYSPVLGGSSPVIGGTLPAKRKLGVISKDHETSPATRRRTRKADDPSSGPQLSSKVIHRDPLPRPSFSIYQLQCN